MASAYPTLAPGEQHFVDLLSDQRRRTPAYEYEIAVRNIENPSAYTLFVPCYNDGSAPETTFSLLMICVQYHKKTHALNAFEALLQRNPDLLWTNNKGSNVLMMLAKRNLLSWAQLCLRKLQAFPEKQKVFINNASLSDWTALHSATQNEHNTFALWLIENGATPNIKDRETAWSPLLHALRVQNKVVISKLLRHEQADAALLQIGKHRECGKTGICPKQMLEMAKENLRQNPEKKQLKTLVVLTAIRKFEARQAREGADKDYILLKKTFEDCVDCTVIPVTFRGEVKKSDIEELLRDIRQRMEQHELLFWVVSSHGGTDAHGEFFYTSNWEKVYIYNDWIHQLSPELCKEMKNKYSIFFPICCRNPEPPDAVRPSPSSVNNPGKYGRIYATSGEERAIRLTSRGSLAALAFARSLKPKEIAEKSIRGLVTEAADYLSTFLFFNVDSREYTVQRLGFEDFIGEEIYFKPKPQGSNTTQKKVN